MAGMGTGSPIAAGCAKCRRQWHGLWRSGSSNWPGQATRLELTGRTRPYRVKPRTTPGPRHGGTAREYRCLDCGHVGWSAHSDVKGDRNEFILVTSDGELRFSAADMGQYSAASRLVSTHLGSTLIAMRQPAWLGEVASLYRMAETRGTMPDVQEDVVGWLSEYITGYGLHTEMEGRRNHLDSGGAVLVGDRVCFRPARFLRFVQSATGDDRLRIAELRALWLRAEGKVNDRINLDEGGGVKCWSMDRGRVESTITKLAEGGLSGDSEHPESPPNHRAG